MQCRMSATSGFDSVTVTSRANTKRLDDGESRRDGAMAV